METKAINIKILEFQNSIDTIKKDAKNPHFKNTYASLCNILSEVKPILNALKLTLTQPIIEGVVYTIVTDTVSGESLSSGIKLPENLSPQNTGSAITYFRRYTISSLLSLEIDDDDDGNAASVTPASQPEGDKAWLNKYTDAKKTATSDNWNKVVEALKGEYTIAQVEAKYKLSKELKAELIQIKETGGN